MYSPLKTYQAILRELDKYNSPSFEVADFNYFYNKARLERCNMRYAQYETTQQLTDDLGVLETVEEYVDSQYTRLNQRRAIDIPDDMFHVTGLYVTFKMSDNPTCPNSTVNSYIYSKRLTADKEGFITNRRYFEPAPKKGRVYHKRYGNKINILLGDTIPVSLLGVKLIYLRHPSKMVLEEDFSFINISEFSDYIDNEDIKICVSLFLENVEQKRLQSYTSVSKTVQ